MGLTRREFVLSAAVASQTLGLAGRVAISAPAPDQQSAEPKQGFHRYRIGSAECIALYDGIWEKAPDTPLFRNASVPETKRALEAAGLRTDSIPVPIAALLVKINNRVVLCDVGGGGQVPPVKASAFSVSGKLLANLKAAGVDPAEIGTVLISHFHPDHVLGLLEAKTDKQIFPNAEIIVPGLEYRGLADMASNNRLPESYRAAAKRLQAVLPGWKNVLPMYDEDEVVPGIRFVNAPGHTAGHTAFLLSSGGAQLLMTADAVCIPALGVAHPDWQYNYDQDPEKAVETRRRLLDWVVSDNMLICGTHFPWPGVGRVAKEGSGFAFIL